MIRRLLSHLRGNAIAYAALFVALGGTSYAAVSLPRNSVGTRQLRNGAVTPSKLGAGVGGEVFAAAEINSAGTVLQSHPAGIKTRDWHSNSPGLVNTGGIVEFNHRIPKSCFPFAMAGSFVNTLGQDHLPGVVAARLGNSAVQIGSDSATPIAVTILCPR